MIFSFSKSLELLDRNVECVIKRGDKLKLTAKFPIDAPRLGTLCFGIYEKGAFGETTRTLALVNATDFEEAVQDRTRYYVGVIDTNTQALLDFIGQKRYVSVIGEWEFHYVDEANILRKTANHVGVKIDNDYIRQSDPTATIPVEIYATERFVENVLDYAVTVEVERKMGEIRDELRAIQLEVRLNATHARDSENKAEEYRDQAQDYAARASQSYTGTQEIYRNAELLYESMKCIEFRIMERSKGISEAAAQVKEYADRAEDAANRSEEILEEISGKVGDVEESIEEAKGYASAAAESARDAQHRAEDAADYVRSAEAAANASVEAASISNEKAAVSAQEADRAKEEADRAKTEADRSKTEADRAEEAADRAESGSDVAAHNVDPNAHKELFESKIDKNTSDEDILIKNSIFLFEGGVVGYKEVVSYTELDDRAFLCLPQIKGYLQSQLTINISTAGNVQCASFTATGNASIGGGLTVNGDLIVKGATTVTKPIYKEGDPLEGKGEPKAYTTNDMVKDYWTVFIPVGTILCYGGVDPPNGFLECDGSAVEQDDFPELFEVIGHRYNDDFGLPFPGGFKIPDLRGEFIRGWDNGAGVDTGRMIGSRQGDAIRNITGGVYWINSNSSPQQPASGALYWGAEATGANTTAAGTARNGILFNASRQVPTANENRPRNVAIMYIIKY